MAIKEGIQVSTSVLIDTSATMRKINKDLDSKLAAINKEMNILEATWKSEAGTDIRTYMNKLKPRFEQYKGVVEAYCKFLDTTAKSYEGTETVITKNASAFK